MQLVPYINFAGTAGEALELYTKAFGGKVEEVHLYSENEELCKQLPADWHTKIMHATFKAPDLVLMVSDVIDEGEHCCSVPKIVPSGSPISLSLDFKSAEEQQRVFDVLAENARKIIMPLQDTFWGARFGILADSFGIRWMFNHDKPSI
jgi:PhnB protein